MARKGPTLQNISDRLEQLEILLSRFAEGSQATTRDPAGATEGPSRTHTHVQSTTIVDAITGGKSHTSGSTWELLLDHEQVVPHANNPNIEISPGDVSVDFRLDFIRV